MADKQRIHQVQFEGKIYFKKSTGWVGSDHLVPPTYIIANLNGLLRETLEKEIENSDFPVQELLARADAASRARDFSMAEKYIRKALEKAPEHPLLYTKLCRIMRDLGRPERALAETENIPIEKHDPLRISRGAAMCDLEMYTEAKEEIRPVLARGSERSKEYAFQLVRRIKKYAPSLYPQQDEY